MSRSKVIANEYTPSHDCDHLCQIWQESIQNCMCCRADTTRYAILWQFYCKVMAEWPWRYKSRSKVIMHNTPSHASDHLCLIWKESIENSRSFTADMACGMDGRMEWNQYTPPPPNSFGGGYNQSHISQGPTSWAPHVILPPLKFCWYFFLIQISAKHETRGPSQYKDAVLQV